MDIPTQSICNHYSCFENMGRFLTLKKNWVQNMECKKQGAKNRVIVIQKEKRSGCLFFFWATKKSPDLFFSTLFFPPHILDTIFSGLQTDPCFQNKNSGCRLTGSMLIVMKMSVNFPGQYKLSKKSSELGKFPVIPSFF